VLRRDQLARFAPGVAALVRYRRGDFPSDLAAGLAVAAVTVPASIANAQLAGFPPVIGLYAPYFKREALKVATAAGPDLKWFIIDLLPVNMIDATGFYAMKQVFDELHSRGVVAGAAAREAEWADWAARRGLSHKLAGNRFFTTLRRAATAYKAEVTGAAKQSRSSPDDSA
jgi:MFS superfamily sulfate permease-like transporter